MKRCSKRRFRTELDAKIALAKLVWRDKGETRFYQCPHCNGAWHTTSEAKRVAA